MVIMASGYQPDDLIDHPGRAGPGRETTDLRRCPDTALTNAALQPQNTGVKVEVVPSDTTQLASTHTSHHR